MISKMYSKWQCRLIIKQHLDEYLTKNEKATYEEWLRELHPNELKSETEIDTRYYMPESDHLEIWKSRINNNNISTSIICLLGVLIGIHIYNH